MRFTHAFLASCLAFGLAGVATAEEGKAEKAGRKVDEAAGDARADVKKAEHATTKKAKKAKRKTGEAVEEAGEKIKE